MDPDRPRCRVPARSLTEQSITPGAFRFRLTVAFVAVAAVSAGVLALGSYFLVRDERTDNLVTRALRDATFVDEALQAENAAATSDIDQLPRLEHRFGFRSVVVTARGVESSLDSVGLSDLPAPYGSATPAEDGGAGVDLEIRGKRFLLVPSEASFSDGTVLYLFPLEPLLTSLERMAGILWRLWVIVVVLAALVGNLLARRVLRPVARASAAARSLAEGLLDTRLPVERQDEFGAWAISFNQMADALQEKISALEEARERERRFTSDVSHELRTPLTALVSSASLVEQRVHEIPEGLRWPLERLIEQIRRVRRLLEELMEISRLDAGGEDLHFDEIEVLSFVRALLEQHGWDERLDLTGQATFFRTDRRRLERVLANIIQNAIEHGRAPLRINVGRDADEVVIAVADSGPGIDADALTHLFDRFYKADPARGGGSGLGLSIASRNARLLGGGIEVTSRVGVGTTFAVRLPLETAHEYALDLV